MMAVSDECATCLHNGEFATAYEYAADDGSEVTTDELEVIGALARLFGDTGWVDGDMGIIVDAVVNILLPGEQEGEGTSDISDAAGPESPLPGVGDPG